MLSDYVFDLYTTKGITSCVDARQYNVSIEVVNVTNSRNI